VTVLILHVGQTTIQDGGFAETDKVVATMQMLLIQVRSAVVPSTMSSGDNTCPDAGWIGGQ